jgi:hypothetical protein
MRSVNEKKAKVLRRTARELAAQKPELHAVDTYKTITREYFAEQIAARPSLLRRLFKKFLPPVRNEPIYTACQLVLSAGPKFIYRRLKAAYRRGALSIVGGQVIVNHGAEL